MNPAAALAKLRWAGTTPEQRSAHGRYMSSMRKPKAKKPVKAYKSTGKPVGRPRGSKNKK